MGYKDDWQIIVNEIMYDEYTLKSPTDTEMLLRMGLAIYLSFVPLFITYGIIELTKGVL